MIFLSSNAFSVDDQIADVVSHLSNADDTAALMDGQFQLDFPEYNSLEWAGSWVDTEASGVDSEYMSWVADWIENNTSVRWVEGEPVIEEDSDPIIVTCGGCDAEIEVTRGRFNAGGVAPCDHCDAGADLDHAQRHGDY